MFPSPGRKQKVPLSPRTRVSAGNSSKSLKDNLAAGSSLSCKICNNFKACTKLRQLRRKMGLRPCQVRMLGVLWWITRWENQICLLLWLLKSFIAVECLRQNQRMMIKKMTCVCKPPTPIMNYSFKKPILHHHLLRNLCVKTSNRAVLKQICGGSKRRASVTRQRRIPWSIRRLCTASRWILIFSMMENGKQISEMPTRQNRHQNIYLP